MRAKIIVLSMALLAGLPAAAQAQTDSERRMQEAQQTLRELELRQRVEQVERSITDLDLRMKSEQNLRDMRASNTIAPTFPQLEPGIIFLSPSRPPGRRLTAEEIQAAELAAGNARLRALAKP